MLAIKRPLACTAAALAVCVCLSAACLADFTLQPVDGEDWNVGQPVEATIDTTPVSPDFRMTGLPQRGRIADEYFNTVTFLGDSLTQGLQIYSTGLPNASYCAYKGAGPNSVVNGAACTRTDGGTEIALDAVVASQPDALYILLGTNSLVMQDNDESFLNYYGAMLDMLKEALDPRVAIYVQAIPGVGEEVKHNSTTPGLDNDRIRAVNSQLAALATRKGCYFLDLQEALTDRSGVQNAALAAGDGIHYLSEGYAAWVDYLRTHVAYDPRNGYEGQNPYFSATY